MIEIKDVRKSFGEKEILKGVSGIFETGKTSLVIGASGSGKTVLMKCMVGLIKPTSGHVLYNGKIAEDKPVQCLLSHAESREAYDS